MKLRLLAYGVGLVFVVKAQVGMSVEIAYSETIVAEGMDTRVLQVTELGKSKANQARLQQLSQEMQGTLFEMYPDYYLLNQNIKSLQPEQVVAFAARYMDSALSEKLLADYSEAMSAQQNWRAIAMVAPYIANPDLSESCAISNALLAQGQLDAYAKVKPQIWGKQNVPETCMQGIMLLGQMQLVDTQDLEVQMAVLQRMGKWQAAQRFAEWMPQNTDGLDTNLIVQVAQQADNSPDAAESYLLNQNASAKTKAFAYRTLAMSTMGKYIAKNGFHPQTLQWFINSNNYAYSAEEAENYALAAIRVGNWEAVIDAIERMSVMQQEEHIWKYWMARASENSGVFPAFKAKLGYFHVGQEEDYYGMLGRLRLKKAYVTAKDVSKTTKADVNNLNGDANFARAFALRNMGADAALSNREWNWAVRRSLLNNNDKVVLAAAQRAHDIEWYDRAIYAMEKADNLNAPYISYPTPFVDLVTMGSQSAGISPSWAYGIMRQESRFATNARSNVGAGGLMQIMPATGALIARQLGEPAPGARLYQIDTNIRYGTYYLSMLYRQLNQNYVMATAGYNAGPLRAKRWQPDFNSMPADQYIETIPFAETRNYVKQVMTNAIHYNAANGQKVNIADWLTPIPAK